MTLYIYWNPNPDLVNLWGFAIKWYGAMWAISLMLGYLVGHWVFKILKRDENKLVVLMQYLFIGGLIGARLGQVIFYQPDYFLAHPEHIFNIRMGGLASHGGVLGIVFAMWLFVRNNKEFSLLWTLDAITIVCYIPMVLIRLGNLINSEILGRTADVPWAFVFTLYDNFPRHPVVIYEMIYYIIVGLAVFYIAWRVKDTKPGLYLSIFLIVPFIGRIVLEVFKEPESSLLFGVLSSTQLLSIPFIIGGIYLVVKMKAGKLAY